MRLNNDIESLEKDDMYSMGMFMLYKLADEPEYCAVSELPYILDKKNLLSFCTYFGGQTIKVPTIEEIYSILHTILLYQYVHIDGLSLDQAARKVGYGGQDMRKVRSVYKKVSKVLEDYEFKHRS